jgi:hypothetical protein
MDSNHVHLPIEKIFTDFRVRREWTTSGLEINHVGLTKSGFRVRNPMDWTPPGSKVKFSEFKLLDGSGLYHAFRICLALEEDIPLELTTGHRNRVFNRAVSDHNNMLPITFPHGMEHVKFDGKPGDTVCFYYSAPPRDVSKLVERVANFNTATCDIRKRIDDYDEEMSQLRAQVNAKKVESDEIQIAMDVVSKKQNELSDEMKKIREKYGCQLLSEN